MSIKTIELWGHWGAPNPWKVGIVLDALSVPYHVNYLEFGETKTESYGDNPLGGQGPYYGQATWFARFHPEKLPSAIERYVNEIIRVIGVLELGLERNGTGWLVGDKCTYADLSFVTWNAIGEGVLKGADRAEELAKFPRYQAWNQRLDERPEVRRIKAIMAKARAEHGLPP